MIDRYWMKRLLVGGVLAAGLAVSLYAVVDTASELLVVRACHGLAASILAPAAFTLLGDLFPRERRGRAVGTRGALIALAAMIAPAISCLLRDCWGFSAVFLTVGLLFLVTAVAALFLVKEPYRPRAEEEPSLRDFAVLVVRSGLGAAYVAAVGLAFGLGTLVTYLPLYLSELGLGGAQTGLAFSAFALVAMVGMAGPWGGLADRGAGRVWPGGLALARAALALLPGRLRATGSPVCDGAVRPGLWADLSCR